MLRYAFFVLHDMNCLVDGYYVIFFDATHQLNCGGYILWHAMLVDAIGLRRSSIYALLLNESGMSYCRAIRAMKDI